MENRFMLEYKKKNAILVQLLVQNYLENENKGDAVFMYGELINDIDVFLKRLESEEVIRNKFKSTCPQNTEPQLDVFIDLISPESYIYSYEVKYATKEYMYNFEHIYQLISRMKYPKNTNLQLILVPSETIELCDDSIQINVNAFYKAKEKFMSLPKDKQFTIINYFYKNRNNLKKQNVSISTALNKSIYSVLKGSITTYSDLITDEYFDMIVSNLSKVSIRILTIKELLKYPIQQDIIIKELGIF